MHHKGLLVFQLVTYAYYFKIPLVTAFLEKVDIGSKTSEVKPRPSICTKEFKIK